MLAANKHTAYDINDVGRHTSNYNDTGQNLNRKVTSALDIPHYSMMISLENIKKDVGTWGSS